MTPDTFTWPTDTFVLIPAFNAASSLVKLFPALTAIVPKDNICVSDDGSQDETADVCRRAGIACISNAVNKGKGAALAKGFERLLEGNNASWIITIDADGQHAPPDLPLFVAATKQCPDAGIIIGKRLMRPGTMPLARIVSNKLTSSTLSLLTGKPILDSQCGFRAYSRSLLLAAPCRFERFEMESEIIMRACRRGFSVNFIDVQTLYLSSQSHISHVADTLRWLRAVLTVFLELQRTTP
jgi:glycosyltransferase involved in cell wall biosynthesis